MQELIGRLADQHSLTEEEYAYLIDHRDAESAASLAKQADRVRRSIYGNKVFTRGLIEISSICRNDCLYCGIRCSNKNAERYRLSPREAIGLVRGAGGAVSLAHPSSTQFDRAELRDFVARLADWGLAGIEVFYTGHLPGQIEEYLSLVREFGLVATGGSDYHGENKPAVRIGVAYGGLKVPDEAFDAILARCDRPAAAAKP